MTSTTQLRETGTLPPDVVCHPVDALVTMSRGGVSVVVDLLAAQMPAIRYWGPAFPDLDEAGARALVDAAVPVVGSNNVEAPPRVAIIPEHHTGWTGRPGLSGSYAGVSWSPRFTVVAATVDSTPLHASFHAEAASIEVVGIDETGDLRLDVVLELMPSGLLRSSARLTNLGHKDYSLHDLSLAFPVAAEATQLLDFSGLHANERVPQRAALTTGIHLRENRKGRTGADSAYVLHAGTPGFSFAEGAVWAVHTGWSGNHRHYAERVFTGQQLLGGGEVLLPDEIRLRPLESYATPWLYGSFGVGLDAVAQRFHAYVRSRPNAVDTNRPVTLNVWEAVYFDHDLVRLVELADRAADIGVERFVLDDGWFGSRRDDRSGLGDWVVSEQAWPVGLHPLVDYVHGRGMQFGLWFEPEMVNPDSDVARAHPEWVLAARAQWPVESRTQQVLNLAIPEAYEHVRGQMFAVLDEHKVDYIKWDHNRDLVEAGSQPDGGRAAVHEQTLAFYRLLDELHDRYPGLEIESCSSGGARVDLGVLEHSERVWVSDNIDPHDRQRMMRWTTQLLPPEYMGSHIASPRSHTTGRRHDLGFRAGTAVFGHLGIEWDITRAGADDLRQLGEWITYYKEHRDLLLGGDVVRIDTPDPQLFVHGVIAHDRTRAIFAMTSMDTLATDPAAPLKLRGLDPDGRYRVRPRFVGSAPAGLAPPAWWGEPDQAGEQEAEVFFRTVYDRRVFPGTIVTGRVLAQAGLASPRIHPDQTLILHVDRVAPETETETL